MDTPILRDPEVRHRGAPRGPRTDRWPTVVDFLKQHPREWAYVGDFSTGIAPAMRRGDYPAFCPEGMDLEDRERYMTANYEITVNTVRDSKPKRVSVYIRWIGDGE